MARTPSKRWDQFDEQDAQDTKKWLANGGKLLTRAQLMRRQHAAFVREVKKRMITDVKGDWDKGHNMAIKDILAALQQGGKK